MPMDANIAPARTTDANFTNNDLDIEYSIHKISLLQHRPLISIHQCQHT
jgi:hypothetical protein